MKKILFCLQTMVCGGVEKELLTILNRFDPNEYELSVLLFYSQDLEMEKKIPQNVNVINLSIDKSYYCGSFKDIVRERCKKFEVIDLSRIVFNRLYKHIPLPVSISIEDFPGLNETYDYAVCYHMHSPLVLKYVAEKINARIKYAWIHNDFLTTEYPINQYSNWLKEYNAFFGVSDRLTEEFKNICPDYKTRSFTLHNIVDIQDIKQKANDLSHVEEIFLNEKSFKILTVGRFVEQKGFDLAIKAAAILKEKGVKFVWYAIGYGKDEEMMKSLIKEYKVRDCFVILGRKENPYSYMLNSDLYVQTSKHEGYGLTVAEARVLGKTIVCTDFAGASEQIINNLTGVIVKEFSAKKISEAILPFIEDEKYREDFHERILSIVSDDGWQAIQEVFE